LLLQSCIAGTGCDPVAQSGCTGSSACYFSPPDDVGRVTTCLVPVGAGQAGADCQRAVDCAPGFRCEGLGFCRRLCYFSPPDGGSAVSGACPPAEGVCDLFYGSTDRYGVCGLQ
jgi:hypothetical protein